MRRWVAIGIVAGGLAAMVAASALWLDRAYVRPGPAIQETILIIEPGASVAKIAAELERAHVIEHALVFRVMARLVEAHRTLRAGEYAFPAGSSLQAVILNLRSGHTVQRRFTVVEGATHAAIGRQLAHAYGLAGPPPPMPPEGWLGPETYFYTYGDTRAVLVERMHDAQRRTIAELWSGRAAGLPIATPDEALVLASIIERETAIDSERTRVAGVFVNRLRKGMRLQSDPTVIYAVTDGDGEIDRPLSRRDLAVDSPYNTYARNGLPPGAISNPGRASIAAALNPAETGDLYFVADGTGGHAFAATLAEHNRNVARWRRLQRSPGGP